MIHFNQSVLPSEHKFLPNHLCEKYERSNGESKVGCTYTSFITDEFEEPIYIAVIPYKISRSPRTMYVLSEPIWNFIADQRTLDQQLFIDKHIDEINEKFIATYF